MTCDQWASIQPCIHVLFCHDSCMPCFAAVWILLLQEEQQARPLRHGQTRLMKQTVSSSLRMQQCPVLAPTGMCLICCVPSTVSETPTLLLGSISSTNNQLVLCDQKYQRPRLLCELCRENTCSCSSLPCSLVMRICSMPCANIPVAASHRALLHCYTDFLPHATAACGPAFVAAWALLQ